MIGKVCRFYGWTPDYCLKMPAQRFFLMYDVVDRLRGKELADQCFVSRAANMENPAFQATINYFENIGTKKEKPKDIEIESYIKDQPMMSGDDAKYAVMGLLAKDTRISRRVVTKKVENPHPRRKH